MIFSITDVYPSMQWSVVVEQSIAAFHHNLSTSTEKSSSGSGNISGPSSLGLHSRNGDCVVVTGSGAVVGSIVVVVLYVVRSVVEVICAIMTEEVVNVIISEKVQMDETFN